MIIFKKNLFDIRYIYISCCLSKNSFNYINKFIIFNINTLKIDEIFYFYVKYFLKSYPAVLNYFLLNLNKYPNSLCISLNNIVYHGISKRGIKLNINDILNLDISLIKNGYFSDMSKMFIIFNSKFKKKLFLKISFLLLWKIFNLLKKNIKINKISILLNNYIKKNNYSLVNEYFIHGIGFFFHENPKILYFKKYLNFKLNNNSVFTIEPIINIGEKYILKLINFWESKTFDNKISSQWEHTILLLKNNFKVLT